MHHHDSIRELPMINQLNGSLCACLKSSIKRPVARVVHGQTVAPPYAWYWLDDVRSNFGTFEHGTLVPLILSFELQRLKRKPKEFGTYKLVHN